MCGHRGENSKGETLTQMALDIPDKVMKNYRELLSVDQYPPCYQIIPSLTRLTVHAWMNALQTERLEQKTNAIEDRVRRCNGDWENAYFVTLARNFGFGVNGEAFEEWAFHIPLQAVGHHRDDILQIEAIFMGQAGLLELNTIPERYQKDALNDGYFAKLRNEYKYLAHKFNLTPMDYRQWRFLRLRPQNFPHIRISQLAHLYYQRKAGLSQLVEAASVEDAKKVLATAVTPYWETHYTFGSTSVRNDKTCLHSRSTCCVSTPWFPFSLPMADIGARRNIATELSTFWNSYDPRTTTSSDSGNSVDSWWIMPATRRRSSSSRRNTATRRNVCAVVSDTNI